MWKVAIVHFLLTLFLVWKLGYYSTWTGPVQKWVWFNAWGLFWFKVFVLCQPVLVFLVWIFRFLNVSTWGGLSSFLAGVTMILSVIYWSICFGWLYTKLVNWLNHFPVLGKRAF
jgi:hypothetical protein